MLQYLQFESVLKFIKKIIQLFEYIIKINRKVKETY